MLSHAVIQRHFRHLDHDRMLKDLSDNGMVMPLPLRLRLGRPDAGPAAATALGLRRLLELTYSPTPASAAMTERLLGLQQPDGSFGHDPVAAAAAVAALGRVLREHGRALTPDRRGVLENARLAALASLAAAQAPEGPFTSPEPGDDPALAAAFILYLLAGDDAFRGAIRYADLMTWMETRADCFPPAVDELWRMALLDDGPRAPSPAPAPVPAAA